MRKRTLLKKGTNCMAYFGVMTWLYLIMSCRMSKLVKNGLSGRKSRVRTELRRSSASILERVKKRFVLATERISQFQKDDDALTKRSSSLSRELDRITPELCREDRVPLLADKRGSQQGKTTEVWSHERQLVWSLQAGFVSWERHSVRLRQVNCARLQ